MSWINYVKWPTEIKRAFGNEVPSLLQRQIIEVAFELEAIRLRILINPIPPNTADWQSEGYVSLVLEFRLVNANFEVFDQRLVNAYLKIDTEVTTESVECRDEQGSVLFKSRFESLTTSLKPTN